MKSFPASILAVLLFFCGARQAACVKRDMNVEFPNAGRPGVLKVVSGEGDVTITGYDGKNVVITAKSIDESVIEENEKAKGLKRISGTGFNVSTDSDENAVIIVRPLDDPVDLDIKVPRNTSLNIGGGVDEITPGSFGLPEMVIQIFENIVSQRVRTAPNSRAGGIFNGDVDVKDIAGGMEIRTLDGNITLSDVSGSAIVNSLDGVVKADFSGFNGDKPMAFSTVDGDVDITLPSNVKATITASNVDGDVYTDFDIDLVQEVRKIDPDNSAGPPSVGPPLPPIPGLNGRTDKSDGDTTNNHMRFMGFPGKSLTGEINGGGMEIRMGTLDGDIFIRKGK